MRLIDADELKKETTQFGDLYGFNPVWQIIDNAPTVEPDISETYGVAYEQGFRHGKEKYERPQGEWIQYRKGHYTGVKCSLCDTIMDFTTNYCPKCGADMRGN